MFQVTNGLYIRDIKQFKDYVNNSKVYLYSDDMSKEIKHKHIVRLTEKNVESFVKWQLHYKCKIYGYVLMCGSYVWGFEEFVNGHFDMLHGGNIDIKLGSLTVDSKSWDQVMGWGIYDTSKFKLSWLKDGF
jgi:hypothetical protein